MPRIRSLKWELFEDEALAQCSRDARLLFIGLIAWADDYGNQRANAALVRGRVFPYDEDLALVDIDRMLAQLAEVGVARLYQVDGERFLHLRGWQKHQRIDNAGKPQVPGPDKGTVEAHGRPAASRRESPLDGKGEDRKGVTTTSSAAPPTREDAPLSHLLADLIAENDPDRKRPTVPKAWADAERLLQERDGREATQIEHVVRFVAADEFESTVVMSMTKLRKRYPELLQKARRAYKRQRSGGGARGARVEELVERGRKAAAAA